MLFGVIAGIVTGALWGLTFIAARAVEPFTPWDITVGRYAIFGLVSLLMMATPRFRPRSLSGRQWVVGLILGAFCYTGYFLAITYAVKLSGAAIPPLVAGMMPVILAIVGNWREKAVPWRALAMPLTLIALGAAIVNGVALAQGGSLARPGVVLGVISAFVALLFWVVYATVNAAVMRGSDAPTTLDWTGVQGLGALGGSLALLPMTGFLHDGALSAVLTTADGWRFLSWAVVMGIGGSWLAAWAWIIASQRLPLSLAAQLVVFETVFGLIAGFVMEGRWPTFGETGGAALQIVGVTASIAIFTRTARPAPPPLLHQPARGGAAGA